MGDSENRRNQALAGQRFELNLYLLFLHQGVSNEKYNGFILHREKEDAGKFDDLVFEYQENGVPVYRLLQAKHTITPEKKKINDGQLFTSMGGDFDLVKYFVSYRDAIKKYSKKGKVQDFIICTNRSLHDIFKTEIEWDTEEDDILNLVKENGEKPKRFHIKGTSEIIDKIASEYKTRKEARESKTKKRWRQSDPDPQEIESYLKSLTFAIDMPIEDELGVIVKNKIGKEFNEKARQDIYNRACKCMENWMVGTDSRKFWTHVDAKALFDEVKAGYILLRDVHYNVQPPVNLFTGRNEHLEILHKLLQERKRVMISGLGGVGKTELVRRYIEIHYEKYYNNILWINAESDIALENSFRSLASDKLGIRTKNANDKEKNIKVVIEEVYKLFEQSQSLFIFENAEWEQYPTHIRLYLSKNASELYIIVTSRRKWKNENIIKTVELSVFMESEAIDFIFNSLSKFLNNGQQTDSVKKLAETLQYLPLALTQAIAYITAEFEYEADTYQISRYIENFSRKSVEYLDYDFSDYSDSGYTKTVWTTWNITVEALKRKEPYTLNVLNCVSFLLPDNIHIELLSILFEEGEKVKKAVRLLKEYSLINVREKVYSIHRLVQLVTRKKLNCDEKRDVFKRILGALVENDEIVSHSVENFISAWTYFKDDHNELIEKYYHIPATIASILFDVGRYDGALSQGIEALELMKNFSFNDEREQQCVQKIAPIIVKVLCNSSKLEVALNQSKKILTILKDINKRFPYTASILSIENEIVVIWLRMRDINAAMKFFNDSSLKNETGPGEYHNVILCRKEIKADMLIHFSGHDVALDVYRMLLDEREHNLKANDPGITRIGKKIANVIYEVHVYEKAIKFDFAIHERSNFVKELLSTLEKEHEKQKKILPNEHSDILDTQECIISLLVEQGKYKKALSLFKDISDKSLARNNFSLLMKKATVVALLNNRVRALAICAKLKKYNLTLKGDDFEKKYPELVDRYVRISVVMSLLGKFDEALQILEEIWDRLKYFVSYYNFHIANILEIIGHIYLIKNECFEALNNLPCYQFDEALNAFEETWLCYGAVSVNLYYIKPQIRWIFVLLFSWNMQCDRALRHGLELIEICEKSSDDRHEMAWNIKRDVADIYFNKADFVKALNIFSEVEKHQKAVLKDDEDDEYRRTLSQISVCELAIKSKLGPNELLKIEGPFVAIKSGNLIRLKKLLEEGTVTVNEEDGYGCTLLHHAVAADQLEIVLYLLKVNADITKVTEKSKNTVLHIAVAKNHLVIAGALLKFNNDGTKMLINAKTKVSESTALHIASSKGLLEMVRLLLSHGAAYDIKNKAGNSSLEVARDIVVGAVLREVHMRFQYFVNLRDERALQQLKCYPLEQYFAVFRARDSKDNSLLKLAVSNKCKTIVKLILGYKFKFKIPRQNVDLVFLLYIYENVSRILNCNKIVGVKSSIKNLVELMKTGKDDFRNFLASTIEDMLDLSVSDELSGGSRKLAKFVVDKQVKQFFSIFSGVMLAGATRRNDWEAFKFCLDNDSPVNVQDEDGRTSLHYAAEVGNVDMVEGILARHANVYFSSSKTPLHLAAENGHVEVAKLLLRGNSFYIFVNQRTQETGDTALHLAAKNGHLDVAKLLLENHANYGLANKAGHTPSDLAENKNMKDLFLLLDELHGNTDGRGVLERLSEIEPAERRPLLNAISADSKKLWQIIAAKCTDDKEKLLGVIGSQPDTDSHRQAELTKKLLNLMLEVAKKSK